MKFLKKDLNLKDAITKEWVIANGIGGFAASTIIGINTRKYHGLLVAPLSPPARRYVILSKVDEAYEIDGIKTPLYSNICSNFISEGYKNQVTFEKEYLPVFEYKVKDAKITKTICMVYGKNIVTVVYKIKNGKSKAKLTLAPIMNFRDFHCMNTNHYYNVNQSINNRKVKIVIDNFISNPVYINISDGKYIEHHNDTFNNIYYVEEEKRGFYPEENLVVPGRYEIELNQDEEKTITFVCSLEENIEEIDGINVIEKETKRLKNIVDSSMLVSKNSKMSKEEKEYNDLVQNLIISADSFLIYRQSFGLHSILAGFPWFLDWGRDALISFEGLLLKTKRYDIAKELLLTFTKDIKYGLVPNGYSGFDSRPLYNSVDSSLLLFEQVNLYLKYTNDYEFIKYNLYGILKNIIVMYNKGIDLDDNNIYVDKDKLLVSGTENTQNTWMDAKIENFAVTPRNGKAVEINALWYNALRTLEKLAKEFDDKETEKKCKDMASKHQIAFNKKFYNKNKKCLYDCLGDEKLRPNQLFALSLTYPVVKSLEISKEIVETCKSKLLTKYGLRTLAKGEENYIGIYEGDSFKRDMSYHQGPSWVWLLGLYYNSIKRIISIEKDKEEKQKWELELNNFRNQIIKTFKKAIIEDGAVGSIPELYDSMQPFHPGGTFSQAWSVAEILRIITEK